MLAPGLCRRGPGTVAVPIETAGRAEGGGALAGSPRPGVRKGEHRGRAAGWCVRPARTHTRTHTQRQREKEGESAEWGVAEGEGILSKLNPEHGAWSWMQGSMGG